MASRRKPVAGKTARRKSAPSESASVLAVNPIVSPPVQESVIEAEVNPVLESAGSLPENAIYERPGNLLLLALILGWAFNFLFWKQSAGVNFAIAMSLSLSGGIYWLWSNGLRPARNSLWLLIPFVLFAVITFLRREPLTIFLSFAFALLSAELFAGSYVSGRWLQYSLLDYFYRFMLLFGDMLIAPMNFFPRAQKKFAGLETKFPGWGILRGLAIALPIVLCFGSLLASGDVVFREKLRNMFDDFNLENIAENIIQGVLIAIYAYLLIGSFLHAGLKSRDEKLIGRDKPFIEPFLGFPESVVILASVSALFLAFVIIQFQYFFGGQTNIGVEGYTYSQYARRGFNELITVAFFSLVLILGLSTITKRDQEIQKRIYSGLSVVIVVLVMVILASAYQRISLAIGWHGFSRLRLYPRNFLIWLGILLIVVVALEIMRRERYFALAAVFASLGFAVSLTFFNVDAAIVKHNIPRVLQGKNLNVAHLASLSSDAVPALVEAYRSNVYSQQTHEGIGAILTCYLHYDSLPGAYHDDWRSFNLSRWKAHTALDQVELSLQEYGIKIEGRHLRVRTPSQGWYECKDYQEEE